MHQVMAILLAVAAATDRGEEPPPGPSATAVRAAGQLAAPAEAPPAARGADPLRAPVAFAALRIGTIFPVSDPASRGVSSGRLDVEAVAGWWFLPWLGLEAGVGCYRLETSVYPSVRASYADQTRTCPLTLGLRAEASGLRLERARLSPLLLAGIGYYATRLSRDDVVPYQPSTESFGAHLGGALQLTSDSGLTAGLEARYVWVNSGVGVGRGYPGSYSIGGYRVGWTIGWAFR
ncbi:MAG: hypothetical protein HZB56_20390 [Deltaproteobacteria bacterium]|nr:hypothetical protein [Deltaproteobacteria bacterium]